MPSRPSSPRLRPCIAELLRTCVHPQPLLLRLERIAVQTLSLVRTEEVDRDESNAGKNEEDIPREFYHLWLSDGELMIQAVLEQPIHEPFFTKEPAVGSLIDLKRFRVRRGKRIHSAGEVVYLAIADYETVLSADPATSAQTYDLANEGGFIREGTESPTKERGLGSQLAGSLGGPPSPAAMLQVPSSQDSDNFETIAIDPEILDRRRGALHELANNTESSASGKASRDQTPRKRRKPLETEEVPATTAPAHGDRAVGFADMDRGRIADAINQSSGLSGVRPLSFLATQQANPPLRPPSVGGTAIATTIHTTPPLHSLFSLLNPPPHSPLPSRNYTCSIFGIVSWCSPNLTFPRHAQSPFPPKRHIKIHDPSIASRYAGITLAVYDDARTFKPKIGTVALFRGVVMQRWEGEVILNAYARRVDREGIVGDDKQGERAWYVDDEACLSQMGYDVRGMKNWWAERNQGKGQKRINATDDRQQAK
jgi:hypothetical protein